jgi:hypothetical protein
MHGAWLTGTLIIMAADVSRTVAPPAMPDLHDAVQDDVELILGKPDTKRAQPGLGRTVTVWSWERVDWLGGRQVRFVGFESGIVDGEWASYHPFVATPPWLDALRDTFRPRPAP